jgi:hypothetical protein
MYTSNAGLWPTVAAPSSESRARAQRIELAQAKAAPDPHQPRQADSTISRILQALRGTTARTDRALA